MVMNMCTQCGADLQRQIELEKDKTRIDWLQREERELWISTTCCDSMWAVSEWGDEGKKLGEGSTLRDAIDNAMENDNE